MLLKDKVTLIMGATSGIGKAGAMAFLREGAILTIVSNDEAQGKEVAEESKQQGYKVTYAYADVSRISDIEKVVKMVVDTHGRIDIFWHNVGIFLPGHIETVTEENYDREMTVSLKAALFGTKLVMPVMKRTGGSILFTSSMVGLRPSPYNEGYSITHGIEKAALIMLMRCLVEPLAKYNIRVNCICPGPVATNRWLAGAESQAAKADMDVETYLKTKVDRLPLKRMIAETEIADAILFLLSDKASGITGAAFPVDGGFSAV
ncbi:SDR family NAD(P)-dependent oxidoreductase [Chloroflexota bacterium]